MSMAGVYEEFFFCIDKIISYVGYFLFTVLKIGIPCSINLKKIQFLALILK